jgi:CHAT domain-containing protein
MRHAMLEESQTLKCSQRTSSDLFWPCCGFQWRSRMFRTMSFRPTCQLSVHFSAAPLSASSFKMMAVIQPRTLPCTAQEIQKIGTYVPNECLVRLGISGAPVSVEEVVSHLPTVSIAHFACHGQQNKRNLESAPILEDSPLKVSRIMRQSMPSASLAFLCACQTAMGDENLPDEAIHLGATLLFAGFRGVVATIWWVDWVVLRVISNALIDTVL